MEIVTATAARMLIPAAQMLSELGSPDGGTRIRLIQVKSIINAACPLS